MVRRKFRPTLTRSRSIADGALRSAAFRGAGRLPQHVPETQARKSIERASNATLSSPTAPRPRKNLAAWESSGDSARTRLLHRMLPSARALSTPASSAVKTLRAAAQSRRARGLGRSGVDKVSTARIPSRCLSDLRRLARNTKKNTGECAPNKESVSVGLAPDARFMVGARGSEGSRVTERVARATDNSARGQQ